MQTGLKPFLIPVLLLIAAVVAAAFSPLATLALFALSLATFFGMLSARTASREPRRFVGLLIAVCVLIVPARVIVELFQRKSIDLQHEMLMFAATLVLVAAFLAGRWVGRRS